MRREEAIPSDVAHVTEVMIFLLEVRYGVRTYFDPHVPRCAAPSEFDNTTGRESSSNEVVQLDLLIIWQLGSIK